MELRKAVAAGTIWVSYDIVRGPARSRGTLDRSMLDRSQIERVTLTIAWRTAECGKFGSLGCKCMVDINEGLCKTRDPQGSHLKKTSILGT